MSLDAEDWRTTKGITNNARLGYLLQSGIGTDVTLIVGEKKEPMEAHKTILIAASPVFEKLFTQDPKIEKLEILGVQSKAFRCFLKFIYTGDCSKFLMSDYIIPLFNAAKHYKVSELSLFCINKIKQDLNKNNALALLQQAIMYNEKEMEEAAISMICKHAYEIVVSPQFLELEIECLEKLVPLNELAVRDEMQLFEALMSWAEAECRRQGTIITPKYCQSVLDKLIQYIRFPQMEPAEFSLKVAFKNILTIEQLLCVRFYFDIPTSQRSGAPLGLFNPNPRKYYSLNKHFRQ